MFSFSWVDETESLGKFWVHKFDRTLLAGLPVWLVKLRLSACFPVQHLGPDQFSHGAQSGTCAHLLGFGFLGDLRNWAVENFQEFKSITRDQGD